MKTPEGRAKGLMFRQHMPEDRGMLFDFEREEPVAMWMRNTYIPLDMLFIRANGVVHRVHERAQPLDETTIPAGAPVRFVLELNGGVAAKLGIKAGRPREASAHPLTVGPAKPPTLSRRPARNGEGACRLPAPMVPRRHRVRSIGV